MKNTVLIFCSSLLLAMCTNIKNKSSNSQKLILGVERTERYLPLLKGKKVGLLINQSSIIHGSHLVDTLLELGIDISCIFAPEHGFRGKVDSHVSDGIDAKTQIPILSMYKGKDRKPNAQAVKEVDFIIFDIQDVGARFYTFISSMQNMMQVCAEVGTKMIVLDRPNPNGDYVDGMVLDTQQIKSFVGMIPIPVVHGMTVGELAKMINNEGWLGQNKKCELTIIPCLNYNHTMNYSLPIKPSPNLPNDLSIRLYPSLCFFEATNISIGRGTDFPFQTIAYPDSTMGDFTFTPISIKGVADNPLQLGAKCYGIDLREQKAPTFTLKYIIDFYTKYPGKENFFSDTTRINKLAGNRLFKNQIQKGMSEQEIRKTWEPELSLFKKKRKKYLLYPDFK